MIYHQFILSFISLSSISLAKQQSGCGHAPASVIGESTDFNLTMRDPATGDEVLRTYAVNVPATYDPN